MRQGLHTRNPITDAWIRLQRNATLRRVRDIRVAGKIGKGRILSGEKGLAPQFGVHEPQHALRQPSHELRRHAGIAETRRKPCPCRTEGNLAGCQRQPALDLGRMERIIRQPAGTWGITPGKINEDGIAVCKHVFAILQDRNLAERIHAQEFRTLANRGWRIDTAIGKLQQVQEQFDAMGVAGQRRTIEDEGR